MIEFPGFGDVGQLAAWAAALLATYAGPAGKKVMGELADRGAKAVAGKLCAGAAGLWGWLKKRFAGDPVRARQIEAFEQAPEARQDDLRALLKQHLESDEEFRRSIRPMLEELGALQGQLPRPARPNTQIAIGENIRQIQGNGNIQR